ncbi:MAG: glyoxalase [bacterium]|nr:glyoxalase [bacterium]
MIASAPSEAKFELFVNDPITSIEFYEAAGFEIVEAKSDGYTTLRTGPIVISLSPLSTWIPLRWLSVLRGPPLGTEIVLYADRLEDTQRRLTEAGFKPTPVVLQEWGLRDFRVRDPEGYYIRFTEGRAATLAPTGSE